MNARSGEKGEGKGAIKVIRRSLRSVKDKGKKFEHGLLFVIENANAEANANANASDSCCYQG